MDGESRMHDFEAEDRKVTSRSTVTETTYLASSPLSPLSSLSPLSFILTLVVFLVLVLRKKNIASIAINVLTIVMMKFLSNFF